MARFFYRILLVALIPALVVRLLWRARKQPEYLQNLAERFGFYAKRPSRPLIWLHSVSVGETRAAEPLVKALLQQYPTYELLVTCMTPTGRAAALALYGEQATVVYLPYDFQSCQRRFLKHWRPRLGLLMETELWPNLLAEANHAGVAVLLVNARLSERSARGYRRCGALLRPAVASLSAVAAQTPADAERLVALGAKNVEVCGNLKFEVRPDPLMLALGAKWKEAVAQNGGARPVWLAASTREGEEAVVLDAYQALDWPGLLLVLVPRHPQRVEEVAKMLEARKIDFERRSVALPGTATQVWLGDSMGEMAAYFAMADFCVMGGSLLPFGSQNLIEPCACACPVLLGPSDFNFRQAAMDALAAGAAVRVGSTSPDLAIAVRSCLTEPQKLSAMRQAATLFSGSHQGATARILALAEKYIS